MILTLPQQASCLISPFDTTNPVLFFPGMLSVLSVNDSAYIVTVKKLHFYSNISISLQIKSIE